MLFAVRFLTIVFFLSGFINSVAGQRNAVEQQYIFPVSVELLSGDAPLFRTLYRVINLGPEVQGQMDFYFSSGQNFLSSGILVPTNGMVEFPRFIDFSVIQQNGWARIILPAAARVQVGSSLITLVRLANDGFQIVNTTSLQAVIPAKKFRSTFSNSSRFRAPVLGYFPPVDNDPRQTAFALVNPSATESVQVQLTVLDSKGNSVCSSSIIIPQLNRVSKFITELLQNCALPNQGSLLISSDSLIAVGALDVFFPEGRILMIPVLTEN
jgi:hypothetical protein